MLGKLTFRNLSQCLLHRQVIFGVKDDKPKKQSNLPQIPQDQVREVQQQRGHEIAQKYREKSAELYDKYLKSREKALLSLDDYCIQYALILYRLPIFVPYRPKSYQYLLNRYKYSKKAGYYLELPKELQINEADNIFEEAEKRSRENFPTHEVELNGESQFYRANSRLWNHADPSIQDPKNIQTYSSDNVFLITKDRNGQWKFPYRQLTQHETHQQFFQTFSKQLFEGIPKVDIFYGNKRPVMAYKQDLDLERGKGIRHYFYRGISLSGITAPRVQLFEDYQWVPKAHLAKYFSDEYFDRVVRLAPHMFTF